MNSAEFGALFCDVPRLTAEEVAAFLSEWTVVGVAAESREDAATAIPAAGFAEHSPASERTNLRRVLSARIAQKRAISGAMTEPPKPRKKAR